MMMKRILALLVLGSLASSCQPASESGPAATASPTQASTVEPGPSSPTPEFVGELQADLQTDKPSYRVGEPIKVTVIAMGLTESAWVWMVPEEQEVKATARPTDSSYPAPTVGTTSALELAAKSPGRYQLYLFPSSETSAPIASRAVEISAP